MRKRDRHNKQTDRHTEGQTEKEREGDRQTETEKEKDREALIAHFIIANKRKLDLRELSNYSR